MICPACGLENIDGIDRCENCLAPFRDLDIPRADSAEGLARSVMEDRLSGLDYGETVIVSPDTPAGEVAQRMKNAQLGCALILQDGKLIGIFTEHDVLKRFTAGSRMEQRVAARPFERFSITDAPNSDIPVEEMRADMPAARPDDLVAGSAFTWSSDVPVSELMSSSPETLHEHDSVAAALNKMSLGRYRHLPVQRTDGGYSVASIKSVLRYIAKEDW
jgi:CBS domain-containing protein